MVWIDCVYVYTHLCVYTSEVQMSTWCTELGKCVFLGAVSVVLKQRQQVIIAVMREIWRPQVGQQLIWVRQLRKKLKAKHKE